jgi:NitT/TauT family transport system substrate-binding protein
MASATAGPRSCASCGGPLQSNLPPLLEKIRQVLCANGVIPANTPLPATVDRIVLGLAQGK